MAAPPATHQMTPSRSPSHAAKTATISHTVHPTSPHDTAAAPSRYCDSESPVAPPPPAAVPLPLPESPASTLQPCTPEPVAESLGSHSQTPAPRRHYRHRDSHS